MLLLVDANVLIDYLEGDFSVFGAVTGHLGTVFVPTIVLDEVPRLDERTCTRMGIEVVEPTLDQVVQAGEGRGRLSFEDHVCLLIARDNGWTCVTNDGLLRRECERENVEVLWGLQLMIRLVEAGHLDPADAQAIAERVQQANPRHITDEILGRFREAIGTG